MKANFPKYSINFTNLSPDLNIFYTVVNLNVNTVHSGGHAVNTSSSLDKHELHLFLQLIICDMPDIPVYVFIGA